MWSVVIITVMAAMTGFYALTAERSLNKVPDASARELAETMGVYRQSVSAYFSANSAMNGSIDIDTLKDAGVVPHWSTLYTQSATSIWANFRDASGTIYVYPATLPQINFASELQQLSQNSLMVGIYRSSDNTLYSPVAGDSRIHASLSAAPVPVPDGAPVWIAARN